MEQHKGKHKITITARERLFLAWQATIAMIRLLEAMAHEEGDESEAGRLFAAAAEEECRHAADLLDLLESYEGKSND
jgi:hypothetical protein